MTQPSDDSPGRNLLDELRRDLAEVEEQIRSHRFLAALEEARVPRERLAAFAGEQQAIISSDRRSFALLASRFPAPPAGDLFLSLAEGEGRALELLRAFAAAVGVDEEALRTHEPAPGSQAYPAFVAWLALNGSRSDASLALLANLAAWGANCGRVAEALRVRYGLDDEAVAFFRFSPTRRPTPSSACWRCSTRVLVPGIPRRARDALRGCCRPTSCSSGTRSPRGSHDRAAAV